MALFAMMKAFLSAQPHITSVWMAYWGKFGTGRALREVGVSFDPDALHTYHVI